MAGKLSGISAVIASYNDAPKYVKAKSEELAIAGLHYTGNSDKVRCESCGVVLNAGSNYNLWNAHIRNSPNCLYVQLIQKYITRDPIVQAEPKVKTQTLTEALSSVVASYENAPKVLKSRAGRFAMAGFRYTGQKDQVQCQSCGKAYSKFTEQIDPWQFHSENQPECKHVQLIKEYALLNGSYRQDLPSTLASFDSAPDHLKRRAAEYAMAGFFYSGRADEIRCYSCNLTLSKLNEFSNPWRSHYEFNSKCEYITLIKKSGIIETICRQDLLTNLQSYEKAPPALKSRARRFALAGFIYTGKSDEVLCRTCDSQYSKWDLGTDPWLTHTQRNPECDYVKILRKYEIMDITDQDLCSKIESFEFAPNNLRQARVEFAQAGFFYTGQGDHVKCYSCGLGQHNFRGPLNPYITHLKSSPECRYLKLLQKYGIVVSESESSKIKSSMNTRLTSSGASSGNGATSGHCSMPRQSPPSTENNQCTICMVNNRDLVLIPCGHIVVCSSCGAKINQCPICRKQIERSLKIFYS